MRAISICRIKLLLFFLFERQNKEIVIAFVGMCLISGGISGLFLKLFLTR